MLVVDIVGMLSFVIVFYVSNIQMQKGMDTMTLNQRFTAQQLSNVCKSFVIWTVVQTIAYSLPIVIKILIGSIAINKQRTMELALVNSISYLLFSVLNPLLQIRFNHMMRRQVSDDMFIVINQSC